MLNSRYDKVSRATDNHGNQLQGMLDRLNAFENEVDQLEDWVMPTIDELESREMSRMDLNECDRKLKVGVLGDFNSNWKVKLLSNK